MPCDCNKPNRPVYVVCCPKKRSWRAPPSQTWQAPKQRSYPKCSCEQKLQFVRDNMRNPITKYMPPQNDELIYKDLGY